MFRKAPGSILSTTKTKQYACGFGFWLVGWFGFFSLAPPLVKLRTCSQLCAQDSLLAMLCHRQSLSPCTVSLAQRKSATLDKDHNPKGYEGPYFAFSQHFSGHVRGLFLTLWSRVTPGCVWKTTGSAQDQTGQPHARQIP